MWKKQRVHYEYGEELMTSEVKISQNYMQKFQTKLKERKKEEVKVSRLVGHITELLLFKYVYIILNKTDE